MSDARKCFGVLADGRGIAGAYRRIDLRPMIDAEWFGLIFQCVTHDELTDVARRLAARHRVKPVAGYARLVELGKRKREELELRADNIDREYQEIIRH